MVSKKYLLGSTLLLFAQTYPSLGFASYGPVNTCPQASQIGEYTRAEGNGIAPLGPQRGSHFLYRYDNSHNPPGADPTAIYLDRNANLNVNGINLHNTGDYDNHLSIVDELLLAQVKTSGPTGWRRNHLLAKLFVLVNNTRTGGPEKIEGTIILKKHKDLEENKFVFSTRDSGAHKRYADFVSSPIAEAAVLTECKNRSCVPIWKNNSDLYARIGQNDTKVQALRYDLGASHSDRLALDVILSDPNLFFKMIRRTGHKDDLSILGMGVRYLSSYDACFGCFGRIYQSQTLLENSLNIWARDNAYTRAGEGEFPFYTLFYSARPHTKPGSDKDSVPNTRYTNPLYCDLQSPDDDCNHFYRLREGATSPLLTSVKFPLPGNKFSNRNPHYYLRQPQTKELNGNFELSSGQIIPKTGTIYSYIHHFQGTKSFQYEQADS